MGMRKGYCFNSPVFSFLSLIDTLRPEGTEILSSSSPLNTENYFCAPEVVLSLSV